MIDNEDKEGYIYILFNIIYTLYGTNVFKLGKTKNLEKRINGYTTAYLDPSKIIYKSKLVKDRHIAENILFDMLIKFRLRKNREFFTLSQDEIILAIDKVVDMVNDGTYIEYKWNFESDIYKQQIKEAKAKKIINKNDILNTKDINDNDFKDLLNKDKNKLSFDEICSVKKYEIKQFWNIKKINLDFLDNFFEKEYILINLKALINPDNIKEENEIKKTELLLKCKIIDELICLLGFADEYGGENVFTNEQLKTNMDRVFNESLFFKNFNKHRLLFGKEKAKESMFKKWTTKVFLNMINPLFEKFGLVIKSNKKRLRIGKKLIYSITYTLLYKYNINEFIDTKLLSKKYCIGFDQINKWYQLKI